MLQYTRIMRDKYFPRGTWSFSHQYFVFCKASHPRKEKFTFSPKVIVPFSTVALYNILIALQTLWLPFSSFVYWTIKIQCNSLKDKIYRAKLNAAQARTRNLSDDSSMPDFYRDRYLSILCHYICFLLIFIHVANNTEIWSYQKSLYTKACVQKILLNTIFYEFSS